MRTRRCLPLTIFLLVLWTAIALPEANAQNLVANLRALKKASSQADLGRRLQVIGFSQDLVEKVAAIKGPNDNGMLSVASLRRAERWEVNVDPDRDKEQVAQVFWQSENLGMQFKAVYLILVLDAKAQAGTRLGEYLFEVDGCDYAGDKPMTFDFAPAPGKPFKEIRFSVDHATSCGTYVEIASRRDVLSWDEKLGRLELVRGKEDKSGVDRMELTRP